MYLDPSKGYCNMTDIHENVHKNLRLWWFSGAMIHSLIHHAFVLPNTAASRVCHCILDTTHLGFLWWTCRIMCVYMNIIYACIHTFILKVWHGLTYTSRYGMVSYNDNNIGTEADSWYTSHPVFAGKWRFSYIGEFFTWVLAVQRVQCLTWHLKPRCAW